jgi:hypothetical protein
MHTLHPNLRRALVGLSFICCIGLVAGIWIFRPNAASARERALLQAEQRWSKRTFGNYHIEVVDKRCAQRIDVRNEKVLKVAPNRCDAPPRAVSDLFTLIRRSGEVTTACIFQGCACSDVLIVEATYHAQLGYPDRLIVRMKAEPNWRHVDYWKRAVKIRSLPQCDELAEGSKVIQVVQLTPTQ